MVSRFFRQRGDRPRYRPALEVLEGRECPAVSATLADGVLTVVGDDGPNRVAVVELGGGAVDLTGDGVPFHFEGVRAFQIATFGGDDRVDYGPRAAAVAPDVGDRDLAIDVGAGDDQVTVRDDAAPFGQLVTFTATIHPIVNLGTGKDYVLTRISHYDDIELDILSADGGDRVVAILLIPAVQKVRDASASMRLDLGPGGNFVDVSAGNYDDVELALTTAGRAPGPGGVPADSFSLNFDRIRVDQLPGWPLVARQRSVIDLGGAADRLMLATSGFADVATRLATGGGDDRARVRHRMFPIIDRTRLTFDGRLDAGNDRLDSRLTGFEDAALTFDLGAGDDRADVHAGAWIADVERPVSVDAQLGAGADVFRATARGYDRVTADLDGGPDGDGPDRIAVTAVLPGQQGPRRRNQVTLLSADLDRVQVLGMGYATADVHTEGDEVLVGFIGGDR